MLASVCEFIDRYPDFTLFLAVLIACTVQILAKNRPDTLLLSVSLMFPAMLVILPVNVLMKKIFNVKRPEKYYKRVKIKSVFEGSFPSFHAQLSAGEATTFIFGIAAFSPVQIRITATALAIVVAGLITTAVSVSRVVMGVHYLKDVAGGFLLGILTGLAVSYAIAPFWVKIPVFWHGAIVVTFAALVVFLSLRHRIAC